MRFWILFSELRLRVALRVGTANAGLAVRLALTPEKSEAGCRPPFSVFDNKGANRLP